MHIISKDQLIRSVAENWQEGYCRNGKWLPFYSLGSPEEIHGRLLALGEDATEEQVLAITHAGAWTANTCSECGRDVDITVHFGEEPGYAAVWADVCPECLRKAQDLIAETRMMTEHRTASVVPFYKEGFYSIYIKESDRRAFLACAAQNQQTVRQFLETAINKHLREAMAFLDPEERRELLGGG